MGLIKNARRKGMGARADRIDLLTRLDEAGVLTFVATTPGRDAEYVIEIGGVRRTLAADEVEPYVIGLHDLLPAGDAADAIAEPIRQLLEESPAEHTV